MQGREIVASRRQVLDTMLNLLNVVSLSDIGAAPKKCQLSALDRVLVCTVASL